MFARILVPTDFSASSDAALGYARMFAWTSGGALHLLHVCGDRLTPPHAEGHRDREPAALRRIRDRLTEADQRHRLKIRVVERAAPAEAILDYARTADIDLIVMGTHGRSGVTHLLMGSVSEKVVRSAPCPVLTTHGAPPPAASFTRILVPTDFSEPSDAALDCARLLQLRFGASIRLLHVLEDQLLEGPFGSEAFVAAPPETRAARLREARERLSHRVPAADYESGRTTSEILFGPTANTISHYAADNGFDLIVMSTHGRTGLAHLLMGSVAERVVRSASCPVITTRGERPCLVAVGARAESAAAS
ncbi:MAG: universal stress protein [Acidobacteria bacterium]|nr:universal stress protein [Acidobacteriota bacterium]